MLHLCIAGSPFVEKTTNTLEPSSVHKIHVSSRITHKMFDSLDLNA